MSGTNEPAKPAAGEGIRAIKTTSVFRLINFELYTKPNMVIMGLGVAALVGVFGYIGYMRQKYEAMGYYVAVQEDGKEIFTRKTSKWDS